MVLGGDGTYLVRSLLRRGREVVSLGVQAAAREAHTERFRYRQVDLADRAALDRTMQELAPSEIFHFAAVHRMATGSAYEPRFAQMLAVNVASVHVALEHLRLAGGRLIYASSIKAFGEPPPAEIDEATQHKSDCLYGLSKNTASELIRYYRRSHGVKASVVYLGNHESPLRPPEFFIPKLARALANARTGKSDGPTSFHTLEFFCDWGSAEEYADIVIELGERAPSEDFVLGTGRTVYARELVTALFARAGQDPARYVCESTEGTSARGHRYRIDAAKVERVLGRRPTRTIEQVIEEIVRALLASG
jgi:GDPmannose 4,6-dehydratase